MRLAIGYLRNRPLVLLLLGCFVGLYLNSFIPPLSPIYQGDTSPVFLLEARRMLEGEMIYRDFFEFIFPGTQLVYLMLFKLLGPQLWIPSVTLILLGVSLAGVGHLLSRQVVTGPNALLPSLLFVSLGFTSELDPNHHWYSVLAVLAAVAVVIVHRNFKRLALAGALCGLATFFTQNRGVVAALGFGVFLIWQHLAQKRDWRWLLRAELCFFATFFATISASLAYFISRVGLSRLLECGVVFPLKYFGQSFWQNPSVYMTEVPSFSGWLEWPALGIFLFIHGLIPLVYLLFLVRYLRDRRTHPDEPWDRLMLINIIGLFLFLGIASAPNWFRLCSVSIPALILLIWLLKSEAGIARVIATMLWVVGVLVLVAQSIMTQTSWQGYLETPVGSAVFLDPDRYDKFRWLAKRTRPGDFFYQADDVDLYFPLGLRNPAAVYFLTPSGFTRPDQVQNAAEALEMHQVRFVVWSAWLDVSRSGNKGKDHLGPLRAYVRQHYHLVRTFPGPDLHEAWERNR
jgi:hypothetical protein